MNFARTLSITLFWTEEGLRGLERAMPAAALRFRA